MVLGPEGPGWVRVKWDKARPNVYRWGADGQYDLEVVGKELPADEVCHVVAHYVCVKYAPPSTHSHTQVCNRDVQHAHTNAQADRQA